MAPFEKTGRTELTNILVRGAHVIARPDLGDYGKVESLFVEGDKIRALGAAADAQADFADEIWDKDGFIVVPGLINAHMHSWQAALRGIALDWNLLEYLGNMHGRVMTAMTPEDVYASSLGAAATQIFAGTTTLGDWCHANLTPAHTDAALAALQEASIRAVFQHASPPGQAHDRERVRQLLDHPAVTESGLLTLALAVAGPLYSTSEVAEADLAIAREFDLVATMHHSGGPGCPNEVWYDLIAKGLIGPKVNIVHGNTIDDELMDRLVDAGVTFTITPEVEMNDGHGHPITGRLRKRGVTPAIGIDIESAVGPSLVNAAVTALVHQRSLDAPNPGQMPPNFGDKINRIEALHWVTGAGAHALGVDDLVGNLAPGKQADITIIDGRSLDLWPNNCPVATLLRSNSSHVDSVVVAGRVLKKDKALQTLSADNLMQQLSDASERVMAAANLPAEAMA